MATAITTSGDLIQGTGSGTFARLATGTSGQFLTTNGTTNSWTAAPAATKNFSLLNAGGTTLSGASTTISGISGMDSLYILYVAAANATTSATTFLRYNGLSTGIYAYAGTTGQNPTTYAATDNQNAESATAATSIPLAQFAASAGSTVKGGLLIQGCNTAGVKIFEGVSGTQATSQVNSINRSTTGAINSTATCSSIVLHTGSGSFSGGTIYVYGAA
jgi:hypothetical protein